MKLKRPRGRFNPLLTLALAAEGAVDGVPGDPNVDMLVGGQAVLEGVMMRSRTGYAVAVRTAAGAIAMRHRKLSPPGERYPFLRWPVLRGTVVLLYALALGVKSLNFSAAVAIEEEERAAGKDASSPSGSPEGTGWAIAGSMALAVVMGLGLFVVAPLVLSQLAKGWLGLGNIGFNVVDGLLRVVFFLGYVWGISFMPEIRRVFMYHGAEHKVVYAFESRQPLSVPRASVMSRLHPRCGTSFLLFVMMISIVLFAMVPASSAFVVKLGARLVLVPLIAGLAYEIIRASGKRLGNPFFRALVAPGMWLQRVTTREPEDGQIEVAIAALEQALVYDYPVPAAA